MKEEGSACIEIDIDARIVGEKEDFYIVRPGEKYFFHEFFDRNERIFLDFPGIGLDFRRKEPPEPYDLRLMTVMSLAIAQWHAEGRETPNPSRDPSDYSDDAYNRRLGRWTAAIQRLFYELQPGTVVVVPGPGSFSNLLVGEIVGRPANITGVPGYPSERLPARAVVWRGRKRMGGITPELDAVLRTANPISLLPRSLRSEILQVGYDQYSLFETFASKLTTTDKDFSVLDDFNLALFVNFAAGALAAYRLGERREGCIGLTEALNLLDEHRELTPELKSNINSPGFKRIFAGQPSPLTIAVLFTMAMSTPSGASETPALQVHNSAANSADVCTVTVQAEAVGAMKLMKLDDWHRACEAARAVAKSSGAHTSMKAVTHGVQGTAKPKP